MERKYFKCSVCSKKMDTTGSIVIQKNLGDEIELQGDNIIIQDLTTELYFCPDCFKKQGKPLECKNIDISDKDLIEQCKKIVLEIPIPENFNPSNILPEVLIEELIKRFEVYSNIGAITSAFREEK